MEARRAGAAARVREEARVPDEARCRLAEAPSCVVRVAISAVQSVLLEGQRWQVPPPTAMIPQLRRAFHLYLYLRLIAENRSGGDLAHQNQIGAAWDAARDAGGDGDPLARSHEPRVAHSSDEALEGRVIVSRERQHHRLDAP